MKFIVSVTIFSMTLHTAYEIHTFLGFLLLVITFILRPNESDVTLKEDVVVFVCASLRV